MDFVHENESSVIAESILEFFPDTSLNDLTQVIERYKKQDSWPQTTEFTEEAFMHLQEIMISAGELKEKVPYEDLMYKVIDE